MTGILLPPLFKKSYPMYLNYGVIGMFIAHEITHGFDDQGREMNKYGDVENWWSTETLEAFNRKKECLINQYGNYTIQALAKTYHAYRNWVTKQGREEPRLPGLNFTNNQLYFISQAQTWCQTNTDAQTILLMNYDVHSLSIFRANGPAQNFPEFSKEFNCPVGSYMNPVDKCSVW
ncbi:endothelin-converting enzyme homolog [Physella acuta]|uniref:endothelin-converting enzyme homolog n=1 Tax=Physella acuta TaxID=109671 RepID=UPI0027DBE30E|nr:endothelin-converting enzyme homolog [Physella acuta]